MSDIGDLENAAVVVVTRLRGAEYVAVVAEARRLGLTKGTGQDPNMSATVRHLVCKGLDLPTPSTGGR